MEVSKQTKNRFNSLRNILQEIYNLSSIQGLLEWDQATYMPIAGAEARGAQLALLGEMVHQKKTSPELGQLLADLSAFDQEIPHDSTEAALLKVTRRQYEQNSRVPSKFMAEVYSHFAKTHHVWVQARAEDNFKKVQPYLEKTLELSQQYANYIAHKHIADPLIDRSDYGMNVETLLPLFAELRRELVPLVDVVARQEQVDTSFLNLHYPEREQLKFGHEVITKLGFDFERGRQDMAAHPFATKLAHGDVRITTRVEEKKLTEALFSSIHETGHALYELGVAEDLDGTPLHSGTSSGVHESQSRLWENLVGRSRAFWQHFYPSLQATFPSQLGNVKLEQFYQAINCIQRSLIRTEADEVTYNLHVIIRFDIEVALLEGRLAVADLPAAWHERYQKDLGVSSPNNKNGVLQDIHWYADFIGGAFQGYTIGNILSCQFYNAAVQAHPDIREQITAGKFTTLHEWLKCNIYQHGKRFTTAEIVQRATGMDLTLAPYVKYLKRKYGEIYGF